MIFTRSISNFWKIWNDTSPRPTGRGFLLPCTDTAQGFSFCPVAHKPHTSRLQRLSCCQCNYTATTSKAFTGLCSGLSADLPYSSAHGTAYTRAAYIPPAPRRTLCRPAQPPYIIMYIRGQGCAPVMDPCQTVQHTADHASPAGSRYLPRPAACTLALGQPDTLQPAGQSNSRSVAGGAEPLAACAAALFGLSPDSQ